MSKLGSTKFWLSVIGGLACPVACAEVTVEPPSAGNVGGQNGEAGGKASTGGAVSSSVAGQSSSGGNGQGGGQGGASSGHGGASQGSGGKAASGGAAPLGGAPSAGGTPVIVMPYSVDFESPLVSWARVDKAVVNTAPWPIIEDPADSTNHVLEVDAAGSDPSWAVGGNSIWTDQAVQVKLKFKSTSGYAYLAARYAGVDNYCYLQMQIGSSSKPKIRCRASGSTTDVCAGTVSITFATGTWYTVLISAKGTSFDASIDGTAVCTGTNASMPSGGIALGADDSAQMIYDDLSVTLPP